MSEENLGAHEVSGSIENGPSDASSIAPSHYPADLATSTPPREQAFDMGEAVRVSVCPGTH